MTAENVAHAFQHHAVALETPADATTVDGGDIAAASDTVPCRYGKLREKIFSDSLDAEKSRAIIDLGHDFGKNRRRGREPAGKPQNPRIAAWHHPIMANITIR